MKRALALALLLCVTLSGCRVPFSLPRAQEPRGLALAGLLATERRSDGSLRVLSATQARGGETARVYEGSGASLAEAVGRSRSAGTQTVSYAHVEHLLVEEGFAAGSLPDLFSFCFQNGEQSAEAKLWLLRDVPLETLFVPEADPVGRLAVLRAGGEAGTGLPGLSLRAAAASWAETGCVLLPALRPNEAGELVFDSYGIVKDGVLLGYLEGETAVGAALLAGEELHWAESFALDEERRVSLRLFSKGCSVRPVVQEGVLKSLVISCRLSGEQSEGWVAEDLAAIRTQIERRVRWELEEASLLLRAKNADAVALLRQAGLRAPWHWETLAEQWEERFATLPIELEVELRLDKGT